MLVTIEVKQGPDYGEPDCWGIQKNIDALQKILDGKSPSIADLTMINDTLSILNAIRREIYIKSYGGR